MDLTGKFSYCINKQESFETQPSYVNKMYFKNFQIIQLPLQNKFNKHLPELRS